MLWHTLYILSSNNLNSITLKIFILLYSPQQRKKERKRESYYKQNIYYASTVFNKWIINKLINKFLVLVIIINK